MPRRSTDTAVALRCCRPIRLVALHRVRLDGLPHLGEGHAEALGDPDRWHDHAPAKSETLELAGAYEFMGGGSADAEEVAGLLDREGEWAIASHAYLGP